MEHQTHLVRSPDAVGCSLHRFLRVPPLHRVHGSLSQTIQPRDPPLPAGYLGPPHGWEGADGRTPPQSLQDGPIWQGGGHFPGADRCAPVPCIGTHGLPSGPRPRRRPTVPQDQWRPPNPVLSGPTDAVGPGRPGPG